MVRAVRSATSAVVCRKSIKLPSREKTRCFGGDRLLAGCQGRRFWLRFERLPWSFHQRPDLHIDHAIDLPVEIDCAFKPGIGSSVVVAVQLLAWDSHLLHCVFLLDAGTEDCGLIDLDQTLGLVV